MNKLSNYNRISDGRMASFGIATLLVIMVHAKPYNWELFPSIFYKISELGSIGVDVFLFLSGMGLYYSMKKCLSIKFFYKHRIMRIIPIYVLIAGILCGIMVLMQDLSIGDYFLHVTTLYLWVHGGATTWYVSFILLLYLFYPVLYKTLEENKWVFKTTLLVGIILGIEILLFILVPNVYTNYEFALARVPIFLIGAIWGKLEYEGKCYSLWSMFFYGILFVIIRIFLICLSGIRMDLYQVGVRISYIFGTLFIVEFMPIVKNNILKSKLIYLLEILGSISLEVYLVHSLYSQIYQESKYYQEYNTPIAYVFIVVIPSIAMVLFGKKICQKLIENKKKR